MRFVIPGRIPALVAGVLFTLLAAAGAQDWQDSYDASGNFEIRTAASTITVPQILTQPQLQVVAPGELASFSVVMAYARGLTYQWRFNGIPLSGTGSTSDTLPLANVSATNEGPYSVVVANSSGSVTSAPAMLMLDSDGDGLPDSWEQTYFGNLTSQRSLGDPDGDGRSNLDEFRDDTSPTNSASARFWLTVLSTGGSVAVAPARLSFTNGETVTLTATAFPPNVFRIWTGATNSQSNPVVLTMNTNKTLQARYSPMDIVWANPAGGDWNVAANWSPPAVPGTTDSAFISSNVTVTVNSAVECRNLTLGSASSSPTLTGSGTFSIVGNLVWSSGTMSGSGRTIIAEGAALNIANPGTVSLTTRTLENGGNVVWSGAGMINCDTAVMTNRPGALFLAQNAARFNFNGGSSRFDNAGTFRKSGNGGTTTMGLSITFNNYNLVEILSGTLQLDQGGENSGTFDLGTGTTLKSTGTFSSTAASSIAGAGNLTVSGLTQSGGTANLAGLVNLSGTNTFSGGTANLTGHYICTNNTLIISGGTANFNATGSVLPAVVNLSSGTLGGSQVVTIGSVMNWTGGGMSGSGRTIIPAGVTLNLAHAGGVFLNGRTLENGGTVLWTGANQIGMSSAVITNRAGALFHNLDAGYIYASGSRFDNAGTFRKSANTGLTTFGVNFFTNYGTVDIRSGILWAAAGYAASSNALLSCALGGTNVGTGYGRLQVSSTLTLNGALRVDLLPGFTPATNDNFTVVTGTRSGTFTSFTYPSNRVTMLLSNTPNSVILRVTEVLPIPQPTLLTPELTGPDVRLIWTATSNVTYRLEFNPDLTNLTNWNALPGDVTGSSNTASKLDALTPSNRLYRVRVLP